MMACTFTDKPVAVKLLVNTHSDFILFTPSVSDAPSPQSCSHREEDVQVVVNAQKISATEILIPFGVG